MRAAAPTSIAALTLLAIGLTGCGAPPADDTSTEPDTVDAVQAVFAAPTVEELLDLEKQANEAYFHGNSEFFDGLLSDGFVMRLDGVRLGKADTVDMIGGVECEVEDGWALAEPHLTRIDDNAYVLSYVSDIEGNCTVEGHTEEMPSPIRGATLWIRSGDAWQAAFHGENLIVDPAAAPSTEVTENAGPDAAPTPAQPTDRATTDALMAAEQSIWQAWMEKDAAKLKDLLAEEIAFVNLFGTYFASKEEALADWTGDLCNVQGFELTDGVGTSVSPTLGILTLTGTVQGSCGGADISGQKIWVNTVYMREGDAWKWVFGFNSPS